MIKKSLLLTIMITTSQVACAQLPQAIARHGVESSEVARAQSPLPADPNRVVHFVRPKETDPEIDAYLQDHYVMYSQSGKKNGKLFVFFPGTFAMPRQYQWLLAEAASLGYLVIGLEYPSANTTLHNSSITQICDQDQNIRCSYLVRQSRLQGTHLWPTIQVNKANSIVNRLNKLLLYLSKKYPTEGWGEFIKGDQIVWEKLVLAGHSQGAGMGALIAKEHEVARVALFSGAADNSFGVLSPWLFERSLTPISRYHGLAHRDEPGIRLMLKGYASLGISSEIYTFDRDAVDNPIPSNVKVFSLGLEANNFNDPIFGAAHASTAVDQATPLGTNGKPLYLPVWDLIIGN